MRLLTDRQPDPNQLEIYHLQCLAINLFNLSKAPIKELRILRSLNQRVHVIFFLPYGSLVQQARTINLDPVVPLTTFDLGPQYRRTMRPLLDELILWGTENDTFHNQQQWGQRASHLAADVISTLWNAPAKDLLTDPERDFMVHYLSLGVAVPYVPQQAQQWGLSAA